MHKRKNNLTVMHRRKCWGVGMGKGYGMGLDVQAGLDPQPLLVVPCDGQLTH